MINKFKRLNLFVILSVGLISIFLHILIYNLFPSLFWPFFFWWLLILYILFIRNVHLASGFSLGAAFVLFLFSALVTSINLRWVGELLMRLSLLGWLVGIIQSMAEYKKSTSTKKDKV